MEPRATVVLKEGSSQLGMRRTERVAEPLYRVKYVAFVDMLGFSRLVRAAVGDADLQAKIVEVIERLKNTATNNPHIGLILTYFSDCVVLSSDRTPAGLFEMLHSIKAIAENLLVEDVLIRGGLTLGDIHHDGQFMFGPAMLEAYDMERCEANNPTVLVSDGVVGDIRAAGLEVFLVSDEDDPERRYLHYLLDFSLYDPTPRNGLMVRDGPAKLVRHYIASRLKHDTGSVRDKAVWLERYWNRTVAVAGVLGHVDREADLKRAEDAHPFRTRRVLLVS